MLKAVKIYFPGFSVDYRAPDGSIKTEKETIFKPATVGMSGPPKCGKSTLAMQIVASHLIYDSDAKWVWVSTEVYSRQAALAQIMPIIRATFKAIHGVLPSQRELENITSRLLVVVNPARILRLDREATLEFMAGIFRECIRHFGVSTNINMVLDSFSAIVPLEAIQRQVATYMIEFVRHGIPRREWIKIATEKKWDKTERKWVEVVDESILRAIEGAISGYYFSPFREGMVFFILQTRGPEQVTAGGLGIEHQLDEMFYIRMIMRWKRREIARLFWVHGRYYWSEDIKKVELNKETGLLSLVEAEIEK